MRSNENESGLSPVWKGVLSLLVMLQVLAVTAEPFRFFTRSPRGTSPAADPVRNLLGPYVEFAYLNHGYFFFAPEPGPSHLIDCKLTDDDGQESTLRFPDRTLQWPRLLYHRHFMLTENLHQLWVPPLAADIPDPTVASDWQAERKRYTLIRSSMEDHLKHRYGAKRATIERVEHRLPSDEEVFGQKLKLTDPSLYFTLPDSGPEPPTPPAGGPLGPLPSGSNMPGTGAPYPGPFQSPIPASPLLPQQDSVSEVITP